MAYTGVPPSHWEAFASLVLHAAYEATMWAAVLNAQRGASNVVLLTRLGGGAFGNDDRWIDAAMRRALEMMLEFDLDVRLVSYGTPSRAILQMAKEFDQIHIPIARRVGSGVVRRQCGGDELSTNNNFSHICLFFSRAVSSPKCNSAA